MRPPGTCSPLYPIIRCAPLGPKPWTSLHPRPETVREPNHCNPEALNPGRPKNSPLCGARVGPADTTGNRPRPGSFPIAGRASEIRFLANTPEPAAQKPQATSIHSRPLVRLSLQVYPHSLGLQCVMTYRMQSASEYTRNDIAEITLAVCNSCGNEPRPMSLFPYVSMNQCKSSVT